MAEPTAARPRELGDYAAMVRRRWRWVAVMLLLGLGLGYAYLSLVAQVHYTSTAKVLVKATGENSQVAGGRTNDEINLDTEAQLVRSEPVAERAGELLGSDLSAVALAGRVTVAVPPNTTVLAVSYLATSAVGAQQGAEAFARAYLEDRQAAAQAELDSEVKRLRDQIELTTQSIQDLTVTLAGLTGPGQRNERAFVLARRSALTNQLESYNAQLAPLVGQQTKAGRIIVEAQLPGRPVDPNPLVILPAGLMLGLVLGLALAAWRERSDKRIHTRSDFERVFGLDPIVALPPGPDHSSSRATPGVLALHHHVLADANDGTQVVLVVGPDAPSLAEQLAYSLAVVAARSGSKTTYVARAQSSSLLARRRTSVEADGTLQVHNYAELGILADGDFRIPRLRAALTRLTQTQDVIVLGLPHNDPSLDIPMLARYVDVAVVVAALGTSRRATTATILADLAAYGVRVLSVTVDRSTWRSRRGTGASSPGVAAPGAGQTVTGPSAGPAARPAREETAEQHRPAPATGSASAGEGGRYPDRSHDVSADPADGEADRAQATSGSDQAQPAIGETDDAGGDAGGHTDRHTDRAAVAQAHDEAHDEAGHGADDGADDGADNEADEQAPVETSDEASDGARDGAHDGAAQEASAEGHDEAGGYEETHGDAQTNGRAPAGDLDDPEKKGPSRTAALMRVRVKR